MIDNLYIEIQSVVYKSEVFRNFIINTHPLWQVTCEVMCWGTPIFLALFFRPRCLVPLLGGFSLMFFNYLEETSSCYVLKDCHGYNTNDNAIGTVLLLPLGIIYSTTILFIVRLTIKTIQWHKQRKRR
jgi:membrane protein insertase Oxa1/YidC/SpoIIIJ